MANNIDKSVYQAPHGIRRITKPRNQTLSIEIENPEV
jgi:hypothetical protein